MSFLKRLFGASSQPEPLRGIPPTRRQKNYMAASGYAYEYFFEGFRDHADAREYVFTVSGDRKTWFAVSVHVAAPPRSLASNERYGVAKLALFDAFDARESPATMHLPIHVTAGQILDLLGRLGID